MNAANPTPPTSSANPSRDDGVDLSRDTNSTQPTSQAQSITYAGGKEAEPVAHAAEAIPLVEIAKEAELAPEVESWMEKVEKAQDVQLTQPVIQDDSVVVAHPSAQVVDDQVILPLTMDQIESAQKHKVGESVRWLAEWCLRLTKVLHAKSASPKARH
jgi:hypothetical protein